VLFLGCTRMCLSYPTRRLSILIWISSGSQLLTISGFWYQKDGKGDGGANRVVFLAIATYISRLFCLYIFFKLSCVSATSPSWDLFCYGKTWTVTLLIIASVELLQCCSYLQFLFFRNV
jgi:hypothetical protein